jgi:DNA-binding MarR family transcriptional regulator
MTRRDAIDEMLGQWSWAPYDLPLDTMAISKRITRIARHLEQLAVDVLAPLGLEPGEFDVIATVLRSGPPHVLTPKELQQQLMISGGGLTKRLIRLEGRGFIARRMDSADRRSLLVALTSRGKETAERAVAAHGTATEELISTLPAGEREQLSELLRSLLLNTTERMAGDPAAASSTVA